MSLLNREEIDKKAAEVRRIRQMREAEAENIAIRIAPTYIKLVEKDLVTLVAGEENQIVHRAMRKQDDFYHGEVWNHVYYIIAENIRVAGFYTRFTFSGSDIVGIIVSKTEKDLDAHLSGGSATASKRKRGK